MSGEVISLRKLILIKGPEELRENFSAVLLDEDVFGHRLPVEHTDNPVTEPCIVFAVSYHDNGCALFVQIS